MAHSMSSNRIMVNETWQGEVTHCGCISSRFNEWGRAIATLQIERLQHPATSYNWHFPSYAHADDVDSTALQQHIAGVFMNVWSSVTLP